DTIVARGGRKRAIRLSRGEVVGRIGVVAVAVEARDIGGTGRDRYRAAERDGLPTAAGLVGESCGRQERACATPQRAGVSAGVIRTLVVLDGGNGAGRRGRKPHAKIDLR